MKHFFKKYSVPFLSLLLILSNFSFASHLMICEMSNDSKECECSHNNNNEPVSGISISSDKNGCCSEETSELTNSNTFLLHKTEQPQDIYTFGALIVNITPDMQLTGFSAGTAYTDKIHLPNLDIPIFNSSLLI